jgi:hypothetical protein
MAFNAIGTEPPVFYGRDVELVSFSFAPNGGSSPTTFSGAFLTSVTRTGAGAYTLVFGGSGVSGKAFKAVLGGTVVLRDNASTDRAVYMVDPGVISGSTLTVKVLTITQSTGAAVDVAANAASWVRGVMFMKGYPGKDSSGL